MSAEFEVVEDPYSFHDPLAFDEKAVTELAQKHGRVPYWANRLWRSERRGWRGIRPLKYDPADTLYQDTLKCASGYQMIDPDLQVRNGFVQHGDVVLSTIPVDIRKARDRQRVAKAQAKLKSLREAQNEVAEEFEKLKKSGRSGVTRPTASEQKTGQKITVTSKDLSKKLGPGRRAV